MIRKRRRAPRAPAPGAVAERNLQDLLYAEVRRCATLLQDRLERELPVKTGFVLWLFHRHGPEFAFISNSDERDMDAAMERLVAAWRKGMFTNAVGRLDDGGGERKQLPGPSGPMDVVDLFRIR